MMMKVKNLSHQSARARASMCVSPRWTSSVVGTEGQRASDERSYGCVHELSNKGLREKCCSSNRKQIHNRHWSPSRGVPRSTVHAISNHRKRREEIKQPNSGGGVRGIGPSPAVRWNAAKWRDGLGVVYHWRKPLHGGGRKKKKRKKKPHRYGRLRGSGVQS
ncbi:hypothetical protein LX36DRAFT_434476 [Colletotrichum falcatum]|nr:hypothetical protein LX36DRAFT_434476 [Colletotrichum falcatum]